MNGTRAGYYEFIRTRLGITTPRQQWQLMVDLGENPDDLGSPPPLGAQPSWDLTVTNSMLQSAIESACTYAIRECRVKNALHFTDITVPAQSGPGPALINLAIVPGFTDRDIVTLRRAYWFNGTTYEPIRVVSLSQLDTTESDYLNQGPGSPFQVASEGELLYLIPGPEAAGSLRVTVGNGALAPLTDTEGFEGLPASYDDALLYISIVELASMLTANSEMQQRAQAFAGVAAQAVMQLTNYWDNLSLDEFVPNSYRDISVIRYTRRS